MSFGCEGKLKWMQKREIHEERENEQILCVAAMGFFL